MRKANLNVSSRLLEKRLAETHMSEYDRSRALSVMRDAEAVADAILWVKDKFASIGALFLKPGYRH